MDLLFKICKMVQKLINSQKNLKVYYHVHKMINQFLSELQRVY